MSAVPVLGSAGNPGPINPETKAKTNLIVNYLPQTMSEEDIRNLFQTVGAVQSCKLIRDKITQVSLGYAFVNYHKAEDAEKAIQSLNGLPLQSKTIKVSYARPSSTAIRNANLYVAYMPKTWTQADLESSFRPYGSIITSKVLVDTGTGLSRGVGFVRYDQHHEAVAAIEAMNGKTLQGSEQPLLVKFANQPKNGDGADAKAAAIGDAAAISALTAPPSLLTGLVPAVPSVRRAGGGGYNAGGTANVVGGPMRHSVSSLRYNPVGAAAAAAAAAAASASSVAGLSSLAANLPGFTPQGWCVFVYNLPEDTQDSLLYQLFCPFGAINSVKVIRDLKTQKCKRYGFVNMVNYDEAYQAILALNGYPHEGKTLQVSFKSNK